MDSTTDRNRWARLIAVASALGLVFALGACGDDDDDDASAPPVEESDDGASSGGATLEISSTSFIDISAPAGGTIEVVNSSGAGHTFTADDGAFDEAVGDGETVDVTAPDEAGEYPFHCEIHPTMEATLTVQ